MRIAIKVSRQSLLKSSRKSSATQPQCNCWTCARKEEYEEGHIADALLVDFYSYNFEEQATAKLSKEKAVAVYCRSGRRSASAAQKLVKLGYEVIHLDGGILAWQRAKMPIAK
jgi:rhodanese-related sulfurtransferase